MERSSIQQILKECGVLQEGHFLLSSGRHSDKYMQCAQLFQYPNYAEQLCRELAAQFSDIAVDKVVAPAIGAIIAGYEVARALGVRSIFTERENGKMTLRRGFEIMAGENVLIVEDVTTTGGSVIEVIEVVKEYGGNICGVGMLVDRSGGKNELGVLTRALFTINIQSWTQDQCPLCKDGIPVIKPGSKKNL